MREAHLWKCQEDSARGPISPQSATVIIPGQHGVERVSLSLPLREPWPTKTPSKLTKISIILNLVETSNDSLFYIVDPLTRV
jgi:hypothetical protein